MRKIAIIGWGKEGQSIYQYLKKKQGADEIFILDKNKHLKIELPKNINSHLGDD